MVELLPRSLASVQFVRIVPVTAAGRDAEFGRCRAIPVAVPTDRRPPAPRVRAEVVAGQRHATIRIEAVGLDLVALQAAEPGLFTDPPAADALAPEFRLRRAAGAVGDPLYAREVARGRLERTVVDDAIIFAATIEDPDELAPFVRASYWAEVRMPPERRLIRGADVEIPPAGGVVPLHPAQLADMPGPFSAPSAPSTVLGPAGPPVDALDGAAAAVAAEAGGLRMSLTAPSTPAAHPLAAPGYRLRIWERWGAGDLALVIPDVPLTGGPLDWIGSPHPDAPRAQPAALLYAIVDPLGRVGPLHELAAPLFVWESLGGIFTSAPAACAPAPGQLAALGAGLDQRLYARRFDGTWAPGWDLIALDFVTGPLAVASPADGTIVLATRGADEDPRYFRYDGATWTAWQPAGWFTTGVALVALSPTDVRIFATRYSRIWFASWNGAAWSAWQRLPADPLPAVDVAATAVGGQIDLAVRGSDHRVRHRASADGTWGPWTPLGDFAAASAPAIARLSPSELVVFARGADAGLHWNRLGPAGPTGWTHVGTAPIAGAPAATSPSPGRVDVFVQGTDNAMYHRWYDGSWHP